MRLPRLRATRQYNDMQDVFLGYNNNLRVRENEWNDMQNISPRSFPMFAPRSPRGTVETLSNPQGLMARDAIVYVNGDGLYINYYKVAGLTLSTSANMIPKTLTNMGAYIIIMPDKKYVNTEDLTEYGSIEADYSYTGDVVYTPARVDGSDIDLTGVIYTTVPPATPANGDYWIDTSNIKGYVLRQYSALSDT